MSITVQAPKPIEVELEGKKYTIDRITQDMLDKVAETEGAIDQASVLLGCKPSEIRNVDVRSLQSFLSQLMEEIVGPGGNPPVPGEPNS